MRITFIVLAAEIWLWESATRDKGETYVHVAQPWVEIEQYSIAVTLTNCIKQNWTPVHWTSI